MPLRWLKHELRAVAGLRPSTFRVWQQFFDSSAQRQMRTRPHHQLVMEGFGGSANSFAWWAIRSVNPKGPISHHLHVPANLILAIRYHIPAILIIRDPKGCVVSLYSRGYIPSLAQGLRHYQAFHQALLPFRDQVLTVDFNEITEDMGKVIGRMNDRFNLNLNLFEHTPENVNTCRKRVRTSSQPSDQRNRKKETILKKISESKKLSHLLSEAEKLYQEWSRHAA